MSIRFHHSTTTRLDPNKLNQRPKKELVLDNEVYDDEDEDELDGEEEKKKKVMIRRGSSGGGGAAAQPPKCQAEKCSSDLSDAKRYYRRHKVCEHHSKAPIVIVAGLRQRFCQQCSRFHELLEFDEAKRSCRRRLAGHNERRRKNSSESHGEGSSGKDVDPPKENHCRHATQNGRLTITIPGTAKHFQIR